MRVCELLGKALPSVVVREAERCRVELLDERSGSGRPISVQAAAAWSAGAVGWGNAVVLAGRRFGLDQWITLIGVPLFGLVGWWWLRSRGFSRQAIGLQRPRADHGCLLTGIIWAAALFAVVCAAAAVATNGEEMRALRAIRTMVGTAFGEELIHRGVLLAVWASTGVGGWVVVAANMVVFGAWHVAGATCDGFHLWEVVGPAGLAVPLVWLRLRFHSIFAPMAFHAATNIGGVFDGSTPRC